MKSEQCETPLGRSENDLCVEGFVDSKLPVSAFAQTILFLAFEQRNQPLFDPKKGGLQSLFGIDFPDCRFYLGGLAKAAEELIRCETYKKFSIDFTCLSENFGARVKTKHSIPNPRFIGELFCNGRWDRHLLVCEGFGAGPARL